jgi:peptidyl-prolyl cis-trans isomerase B (cyclophilin B)
MKNVSRAVWTALAVVSMLAVGGLKASAQDQIPTEKGPILVVETTKGTFEIKTYPVEAPKTVAHIIALTKRGFYNGLRFHRVVPGFVIQVGDPQSRDMTKRSLWGTGGSGQPIGVAEISPKLTHIKGAVAMAHAGDPAKADSQFYVTLAPTHALDGKYAVWGQVISGEDVPEKIRVGDLIKKMYVKPGTE